MPNYRFQITLPAMTGLAEDGFTSVWHTKTASPDPVISEWEDGITALLDFYNGLAGLMPTGVISSAVGAGTVKAYEVVTGAPGESDDQALLLDQDAFTVGALAAPANLPMPSEVAVCLSMTAVGAADVPENIAGGAPGPAGDIHPRARYRGRVYLGPWVANASTIVVASGAARPAVALRDTILNYGDALGTALAADGHSLCVYSRADASFKTVDTLSVDDAFDTVRSRGVKRTIRDTRSI